MDLLENAAAASGATVCQTIFKKFDPQGVTVLCLLSESHISIHTWPEEGRAAVDVYTCGEGNPMLIVLELLKYLNSDNYSLREINR